MANHQSGHASIASCGGGLFGWLLGLFGSGTPTYAGDGQPVAAHCGWSVFGGTPTYQVAPPEPVPASTQSGDPAGTPDQGDPTGTETLRPIAIIVRRDPPPAGGGNGAAVT